MNNIESEIEKIESLIMTYAPDSYTVTKTIHSNIHINLTSETDIFYGTLIRALVENGYHFYVSTRYKRIVITR